MARTFRDDHFTTQKSNVGRSLKNKEKQRVSKAHEEQKVGAMSAAGLHESTRHAESDELTQAKAGHQSTSRRSATAREANAARGGTAGGEEVKPTERTSLMEEQTGGQSANARPQAPSLAAPAVDAAQLRGLFQVLEEGRGELEAISRSTFELGRASLRLVQLSFELAWLTTRTILLARW